MELGFVTRCAHVVHINDSIAFFNCHLVGMLPRHHVPRLLADWLVLVFWNEDESIEVTLFLRRRLLFNELLVLSFFVVLLLSRHWLGN